MMKLFSQVTPYPRKTIERRRRVSVEEWEIAVYRVRTMLCYSRAFTSIVRDAVVCKDIKAPSREKWEAAKALISMDK